MVRVVCNLTGDEGRFGGAEALRPQRLAAGVIWLRSIQVVVLTGCDRQAEGLC